MNGEQPQGEHVRSQRCMCCQMMDMFLDVTGLGSEEVRKHFRNSRVEFLKGIRAILDQRINALSSTAQQGSSIKID